MKKALVLLVSFLLIALLCCCGRKNLNIDELPINSITADDIKDILGKYDDMGIAWNNDSKGTYFSYNNVTFNEINGKLTFYPRDKDETLNKSIRYYMFVGEGTTEDNYNKIYDELKNKYGEGKAPEIGYFSDTGIDHRPAGSYYYWENENSNMITMIREYDSDCFVMLISKLLITENKAEEIVDPAQKKEEEEQLLKTLNSQLKDCIDADLGIITSERIAKDININDFDYYRSDDGVWKGTIEGVFNECGKKSGTVTGKRGFEYSFTFEYPNTLTWTSKHTYPRG